jgi:hypothetical protein
LDEAKIAHDERMALAQAGAWALGRKVDDQILAELDNTSQSAVTVSLTGQSQFENSMLQWVRAMDTNDAPNDGLRYAAVTPFTWSCLMKINAFSEATFVGYDGLPFREGAPIFRWKDWMGVKWTVHTGSVGVGTSGAKNFMWHRNAIGYASGAVQNNTAEGDQGADITWHGDRAAYFINHWMSGGAKLIDDTGVIEAGIDDTGTVPISSS